MSCVKQKRVVKHRNMPRDAIGIGKGKGSRPDTDCGRPRAADAVQTDWGLAEAARCAAPSA